MKHVIFFAAVSIVIGGSHARADVAPPPPESLSCLPGAIGALPTVPAGSVDERGRPARPWPYCAPTTCTSDSDCNGGRVCSTDEVGLCVRDREDYGVTSREAIERGCEPNGTCLNLQSTCERARRCVTPPPAPPPTTTTTTTSPTTGGLCHAMPGVRASLAPWLIAAFGFMFVRSRRPRAGIERDRARRLRGERAPRRRR